MGFLALVAFVLGLAALGEYEAKARVEAGKALLDAGAKAKRLLNIHSISGDLEDMANQLESRGLAQTAAALRDKSDIVAAAKKHQLLSPLEDVADEAWAEFVRLCQGDDVGEISPNGYLGLFNVSFRRLGELGLATNVRRVRAGTKTVWAGDLKPPMTVKRFLSDASLQYRVFVKDMEDRAELARPHVGEDIDGVEATLSGLMAVAKIAGTNGFQSWISSPEERAKFSNTTAAFTAANGVF